MRFDVITLFPELFAPFLEAGVARRAYANGQIELKLWNPRDYADGNYRRVDDRPFGGGPGMVMLAEPLARCLAAAQADRADGAAAPVVLFSPIGQVLTHAAVERWAAGAGAVLICGRYEGIDQRFIDRHVTHQISLGDFVLSGGELPALVLLDAVARLQDGVLHAPSHQQDSFSDGLLEGPAYSRPECWPTPEGDRLVPPVLLSGHHGEIAAWRRQQSLALTARRRPDLIAAARTAGRLSAADERYLASLAL
ncbi:MAG: tRNA (guanosine(37)-N1)-methyltransferase TrmD [Burkholderiales bacterium]|nr:tRNA (guanosine(37)-N1)-methyltransferase TrmD [Burkholderiales bacterium]